MKSESELRAKLAELLALDARRLPVVMAPGLTTERIIFSKAAACKTLLWALGENDDDRCYITAAPGPPVDIRMKARN